jgi:acyl-[acyl carrier protein]--UDP-N-acetylglucosamine O-acyltransferase
VSTSPEFYNDGFHDLNAHDITDEQRNKRKVNIGHDVWIGDNVLIGREVTIGHGAIIAANSLLTKDVAPYMIVGGVPAKVIRPRFDEQTIARLLQLQWWRFHKNHLKGLLANKPEQFIDALQERIERAQIQEYHPKIYTLVDLRQR